MKKLLTVTALVAGLSMAQVQAKDWNNIRIGVEGAYPPFSSVTPEGELVGFDIDIAKTLCEQMQAKCEFVKQDWDGIIPALLARKYDAIIASMSITEERKKKVAFSDKYYNSPAEFIAPKGSSLVINADGLKGKKIGVQRETIHDKYATEHYPDAEIVRYGTQDEAYLDLQAGRVDALLLDAVAGEDGFLKKPEGANYAFIGEPIQLSEEGAGIAIRKQDTDLVEKFNKAIADIRANGKYDEVAKKYFSFDIYGK
ncbi:ABC transporter substrate-binding protein [Pokkaliibacter sp. MBI-7]|uniref:ABC transporter substrate-binding protein n=1 Tax=Pokkaliibacter sp. MBI-7 TaxID=3040600 RepID=UPI00244B9F70|nr:ABC transporter substrate-binding protein [Pokkaliibacter sp. MBI-7]MDH2431955.1 ABC transporter substrate-binding protein [Pokkaliibacter sp. MBI-7]